LVSLYSVLKSTSVEISIFFCCQFFLFCLYKTPDYSKQVGIGNYWSATSAGILVGFHDNETAADLYINGYLVIQYWGSNNDGYYFLIIQVKFYKV
jgi:hypothetical protein